MWHVGMSKRGDGEIVYEPPAGPTIKEAINNAIEIARDENKPVELHINEIVLDVKSNSNPTTIASQYFIKLDAKYRQEAMHKQRVKE